jgi:hypothetical protein
VNLYLKFNDFDCDPLGEDPTTATRRAETLAVLNRGDEAEILAAVPRVARLFDSVVRQHRREGWPELLLATVWGQNPFPVSDDEFALLRRIDGQATVADLCTPKGEVLGSLRRLALRGAIDLTTTRRA